MPLEKSLTPMLTNPDKEKESWNLPTVVDWTTLWTNLTTLNLMVAKSGSSKKAVEAAAVEAVEAVVPVAQHPGLNPVLAPDLDPAPGLVLNAVHVLLPAGAAPDPEDLVNESPDQSAFLIEPSLIGKNVKHDKRRN